MPPEGPTFWLLDERTGWRTEPVLREKVSVGAEIRLAAAPGGPLALESPDGALGGLLLPRGMALDETSLLYLLLPDDPWVIKRFNPETQRFGALPAVGGRGSDARQFISPANIAIAGTNLYVADRGNRRVLVFDVTSLVLRYVWGPWDGDGRPVAPDAVEAWDPADVTAQGGILFLLDRRYGRVYRHRPGSDTLETVPSLPYAPNHWTRIAVDRDGRIYLLSLGPRMEVYDAHGTRLADVTAAGEVRDRFDPPAVRLRQRDADDPGRFYLPEGLTRLCDRRAESPLSDLLFDRSGDPARPKPDEPLGPKPYEVSGTWVSEPLDSGIYRCQWHRIEMELTELPAGTTVEVWTYTDAQKRRADDIPPAPGRLDVPDPHWQTRFVVTGQMQSPKGQAQPPEPSEFLVQSEEGQYLWLCLRISGDGYGTPAVRSIRLHYPRDSYLQYLPAVFSAEEESRRFLERFLSVFQTDWDDLEQQIADMPRYFDPEAVPAGPFLEYLAKWLALPLEGVWTWEQKRNLLSAIPKLLARRGTVAALHAYVQVYVENITGLKPDAQGEYPQIVEGFRERQRLMLSTLNTAELGHGAPLWSLSAVGRLQLGVFSQEGEARLVSVSDPERDLFHEYAHRFRVFIPSIWLRTAEEERMVRRGIEAEKPAHTQYDLCLVEPRLRVGVQSTVGLDTIIGAYPVARLSCPPEQDPPPSRPPRHRLGYDTILTHRPGARPPMRLAPGARIGMEARLV